MKFKKFFFSPLFLCLSLMLSAHAGTPVISPRARAQFDTPKKQAAANQNAEKKKETAEKTSGKVISAAKSCGRFITRHAATIVAVGMLIASTVMHNRKKSPRFPARRPQRPTRARPSPGGASRRSPQEDDLTAMTPQQIGERIVQELRDCDGLPDQDTADQLMAIKEQIPQEQRTATFEDILRRLPRNVSTNIVYGHRTCDVCYNNVYQGYNNPRDNAFYCQGCAEADGFINDRSSLRIRRQIERLAEEDEFPRPYLSTEASPDRFGEPRLAPCQQYRELRRTLPSLHNRCVYCANRFGPNSRRVDVACTLCTIGPNPARMHADCAHDYYTFREASGEFRDAYNLPCPLCNGQGSCSDVARGYIARAYGVEKTASGDRQDLHLPQARTGRRQDNARMSEEDRQRMQTATNPLFFDSYRLFYGFSIEQ